MHCASAIAFAAGTKPVLKCSIYNQAQKVQQCRTLLALQLQQGGNHFFILIHCTG